MQAVILAGGEGRRLRPLTDALPKPMLPVMNRPMLCYTLELLKKHGITDIAVTVCYRAEEIRRYFGDGSAFGVRLTYFTESEPRGTAGSVKLAENFVSGDFVVISGDAVTDIGISAAAAFHSRRNAAATVVLSSSENPLEYGTVIVGEGGRVLHFLEKPDWDEVCTDQVNTGIYVLDRSVLDRIPPDQPYDFAKDLFPRMLREGIPLFGYSASGYWCDVGSVEAYRRCHQDIFDGKIDLGVDSAALSSGILIGEDCKISKSAEVISRCVLGDGCEIGEGASLKDCIVWPGARVENGERLYREIVTGVKRPERKGSGEQLLTQHRIEGSAPQDITPEAMVRLCIAFANALGKRPEIVLNFPEYPEYMSLKFAMLSGLTASGAKVYHLCGDNDRGAAKLAVRQLRADGAVTVSLASGRFLAELLDATGAPAQKSVLRAMQQTLASDRLECVPPEQTIPPINMDGVTDRYLEHILAFTRRRRLDYSVGVCTGSRTVCKTLEALGSRVGISFLFTNQAAQLPELIRSHGLDLGIEIAPDGSCRLLDDTGNGMSADRYWAVTALITLSAVHGAGVYVPAETSETVNAVARSMGGSVIRVGGRELERRLAEQDTPASRLQYALCCDYNRAVVRICEFLSYNNCTLSETLKLLPVMHKISRCVNCPPERKGRIMRRFIESAGFAEIEADGGVAVRREESRMFVRPDRKDGRIHVTAENADARFAAEAAEELCGDLEKLLREQ